MAEIRVEVVCALPEHATIKRVCLRDGATVAEAIAAVNPAQSGWPLDPQLIGVYGHRVAMDHPLRDGDRIELYRPLALDPKEARRRRVRKG